MKNRISQFNIATISKYLTLAGIALVGLGFYGATLLRNGEFSTIPLVSIVLGMSFILLSACLRMYKDAKEVSQDYQKHEERQ